MSCSRCSLKSSEALDKLKSQANSPYKSRSRKTWANSPYKSKSRKSKSSTRKSKSRSRKVKSLSPKKRSKGQSKKRTVKVISPIRARATPFPKTGPKTAGWKAKSPKRGTQRHELHRKTGNACFLDPENEKYPVCTVQGGQARYSCEGIQAAYQRARQFHHEKIAEKALSLRKKYCS